MDYISSSARLSRPQKIYVLELVGAVYILKKDCAFKSLEFAVRFWCEAQSLRRGDGSNPIPKIPLNLSECARKVFGNISEFATDDELEHILDNPFDHLGLIRSEYHLQTLLMIQRILSQIHVDPHPFFLHHLFAFGERFVIETKFNRAMDIVFLGLEAIPALPLDDAISCKLSCNILAEVLCKTFVSVVCSPQKLPLTTVINVLCCFSNFHGRLLRNAAFSRHTSEEMTMLSCVIELVDRMLLLNHRESVELKQWLSRYVRSINSHSGLFSVLQVVCRKDFLHIRIEIVQLLLEAGANPMARDHRGNTPLDCLSCYSDDYLAVVQLLIDFCPSGSAQRNPTPEEL